MNIPFDPHTDSLPDVNAPQVRVAVRSAGAEARAMGKALGEGEQLVRAGVEWERRRIEEGFQTDMLAGRAKFKEFRSARDRELAEIPVDSGVDFDKQAAEITNRYSKEWDKWVKGNVRNQGYAYVKNMLADSGDEFRADSELAQAEGRARHGRAVNFSNLEQAMATAVESDDKESIAANVEARVQQGFLSAAEADKLRESMEREADIIHDKRVLDAATLSLKEGDVESFEAGIRSQRIPSEDEKETIIIEKRSSIEYNAIGELIPEAESEGISKLETLREHIETFGFWDNERSHKRLLNNRINTAIARVERDQHERAADMFEAASKGELEEAFAMLENASDLDNRHGIPEELRPTIREQLQRAADAYEQGERLEAVRELAEDNEDFVTVRDGLSAAAFDLENFDVQTALKDIEDLDVADPVKAEQMANALMLAAAQKAQMEPQDNSGEWADWGAGPNYVPHYWLARKLIGQESVTQREISSYERLYHTFGQSVKAMGAWDGLSKELKAAEKEMRKWHRDNREASDKEAREMEASILSPIVLKVRKHQLRNR